MIRVAVALLAFAFAAGCAAQPQQKPAAAANETPPLRHVQTIEMPGVEGRFDHFAVDVKRNRLFVAALGNNTLEAIDTQARKRAGTVSGLKKPTGVAVLTDSGQTAVAGGDDGTVRFYDTLTLKPGPVVQGLDDADNARYDPTAKRLYVGYGGGALAVIDPATARKVGEIKLDAHPESFQLEKQGKRIFVNVPEAGHVAVVDRDKQAVVATWRLDGAAANFPMALDEQNHRLFVGCRKPARLVVFDTETGKVVSTVDIVADTDDLFYDPPTRQIYIAGGGGKVTVVAQRDGDRYEVVGEIETSPGARTAFFIPETGRLYVAVPKRGKQGAEMRVYEAARR